ncbi:MAG TPA: PqqD family protein [Pyrinomonadaceae bacterium]|nr:PqqD family protein [Pyrinomonadaceae bacterium]
MSESFKPLARTKGLVVNELPEEIVVYDRESHKAHCLNRMAALVWKRCDGRTSPRRIAQLVGQDLNSRVGEDLVWYALEQLAKDRLLTEKVVPRAQGDAAAAFTAARLSRRELVRRLGLAAVVALPLITTIVAPTPVEAAASGCVDCNGVLCCSPATCPAGVCVS